MRSILFSSLAAFVAIASSQFASAATIEYRLLVNGSHAGSHILSAGTHQLTVEGRVTENDISGNAAGFIQASFDLVKSNEALVFEQGEGFLGNPSGAWDSTPNSVFGQHNPGVLDGEGNVRQDTASILSNRWNEDFNAVGAGDYSVIADGSFTWDGSQPTTIDLTAIAEAHSVATLNGANIGGREPESVIGASTLIGIPEPTSLMLSGIGLVTLAFRRRRGE